MKFGEIAAANALSDVYAMGGKPVIALNVVCFPTSSEPIIVLKQILKGGAQKVCEAKTILAGGHSVQDKEPKYGLVVFGEVNVEKMWQVGTANEGDSLILTKPLGTGIAITAIKAGLFSESNTKIAIKSMAKLNKIPDILSSKIIDNISSCTDVTGFGLASHAIDLNSENTSIEIQTSTLPLLSGVKEMASMGLIPAGLYTNKEYIREKVSNNSSMDVFAEDIVFDPQTSGGLLIAIKPKYEKQLLEELHIGGFTDSVKIGKFIKGNRQIKLL